MEHGFKKEVVDIDAQLQGLQNQLTRQAKTFIGLKNQSLKNNNRLESKYEEAMIIINRNLQNFRYEINISFEIQNAMTRKLQTQLDSIKSQQPRLKARMAAIEELTLALEKQISQ